MAEKRPRTYTLTVSREAGIAFARQTREAILPCFPGGTPATNDDRNFMCVPADAESVPANLQRATTPQPLEARDFSALSDAGASAERVETRVVNRRGIGRQLSPDRLVYAFTLPGPAEEERATTGGGGTGRCR